MWKSRKAKRSDALITHLVGELDRARCDIAILTMLLDDAKQTLEEVYVQHNECEAQTKGHVCADCVDDKYEAFVESLIPTELSPVCGYTGILESDCRCWDCDMKSDLPF